MSGVTSIRISLPQPVSCRQVTKLWAADDSEIDSGQEQDILFFQNVQSYSGAHPEHRVFCLWRWNGQRVMLTTLSSAEVNNEWCCTSAPPICLLARALEQLHLLPLQSNFFLRFVFLYSKWPVAGRFFLSEFEVLVFQTRSSCAALCKALENMWSFV